MNQLFDAFMMLKRAGEIPVINSHRFQISESIYGNNGGGNILKLFFVRLCICLGAIGASSLFPLGVVLGAAGIAAMTAAYFIYGAVIKVRKKKYAESVLALSDKILNGGAKL